MEIKEQISAIDFYNMRKSVGWRDIDIKQLEKALNNSMIVIGIYVENEIVAMGRLVGDYSCKAMLTDIIVKPEFQKNGYGKIIVSKILEISEKKLSYGERLLIEANPTFGNIGFYTNCGMIYEPEDQEGVWIWIEGKNK